MQSRILLIAAFVAGFLFWIDRGSANSADVFSLR
jgi:hypothetical protein